MIKALLCNLLALRRGTQTIFLLTVDIIFAHRHDPNAPMLEIVRAFNWFINQGKALYSATNEWMRKKSRKLIVSHMHHVIACAAFSCRIIPTGRVTCKICGEIPLARVRAVHDQFSFRQYDVLQTETAVAFYWPNAILVS